MPFPGRCVSCLLSDMKSELLGDSGEGGHEAAALPWRGMFQFWVKTKSTAAVVGNSSLCQGTSCHARICLCGEVGDDGCRNRCSPRPMWHDGHWTHPPVSAWVGSE